MRRSLTPQRLRGLMKELAAAAPRRGKYRVYLVGGGTALLMGWRDTTIDADLCADDDAVFRDIQAIKERLQINIEFTRPEQFVPALAGADKRHIPIETMRNVAFFHYDPYSQLLAKLVRGIDRDLQDAANFLGSNLVDVERFRDLVRKIPDSAYARYPQLNRAAVVGAIEGFLPKS